MHNRLIGFVCVWFAKFMPLQGMLIKSSLVGLIDWKTMNLVTLQLRDPPAEQFHTTQLHSFKIEGSFYSFIK